MNQNDGSSPEQNYEEMEDYSLLNEHIPLKQKLAYGFGVTASNILSGIVYGTITYFYNTKLGLDGKYLGLAWILFGIWNAINDPLFGSLSDNTRSNLGRRIPFIRYGSLLYGASFILCWYPFAGPENQIWLFVNFILAMALLDTFFSLVGLCYFALPNEMAISSHERASLGLYASILGIGGVLIQFLVPVILLTGDSTEIDPRFHPVMILIGVICTMVMFGTSFFLKENYFAQTQEKEKFLESFKLTLKNKSFFLFEISVFTMILLTTILGTGIYYYIDYILQIDLEENTFNTSIILAGAFLLLGFILGGWFGLKKIEDLQPRNLGMIAFGTAAAGLTLLFFTGKTLQTAGPALFLISFGFINISLVIPALTGDVIDNDELITGKRREGIYAGFNALITKPAISIANWMFLKVIDDFGFKRPTVLPDGTIITYQQSAHAIVGIMFAFTIIPAIFSIISIIGLKYYDLHGDEWRKKKKYIQQLHEKKEREYQLYLKRIASQNEEEKDS